MPNTKFKISVSNMALTHKIPSGDPIWSRFNASFDNTFLESGQIIDKLYKGHPVTTWHANQWRDTKNYMAGQHLGLDFDKGGVTLDSLIKDLFIVRYGSFVYTTMSHTPEEPRCRAMFLLDTPIVQAANYGLAASALLWAFGNADRQCRDAVRFWYGSPGCEFEFIDEVLPLAVVKDLIAKYQEMGAIEKQRTAHREYGTPASQAEVADALKSIPPWSIDYSEWLSILMAIHSQFGDGGMGLAESWGDGKGNEIEQKFKSFKGDGNPAGKVTIATLFGIAKAKGWKKGAN
jgi:hypothetical protein